MSLGEAILEIASDLEKVSEEGWSDGDICKYLNTVSRQLRVAVKASQGESNPFGATLQGQKDLLIKQVKKQQEAQREIMQREELGTTMAMMVEKDGECMVEIPSHMPVGAKTKIGSRIYELRKDRKLYPIS